jgi:hypothetical protein
MLVLDIMVRNSIKDNFISNTIFNDLLNKVKDIPKVFVRAYADDIVLLAEGLQ